MLNQVISNIIRFIILVVLQVLIIDNIELGRFINPFIYVLFILSLPFETPKMGLLFASFAIGLTIDMFYNTIGLHAAASVLMGYMRPIVLKTFSPRDGYETGAKPTVQYLGIVWYVSYAALLIFIHHFALFFLEVFNFSEFFSTIARVLVSSIFTLILVVVTQYLFASKKVRKNESAFR